MRQQRAAELLSERMMHAIEKQAQILIDSRDKPEEKAAFEQARTSLNPQAIEGFKAYYGEKAWIDRMSRYLRGM